MVSVAPNQVLRHRNAPLIACAVGAVLLITFLASGRPYIAVGVIALIIAIVLPRLTFTVAIFWVILCRPGYEAFQFSINGIHLTEVDFLPLIAAVAALSLRTTTSKDTPLSLGTWIVLLAWPAWYVVRFALPQLGSVQFGSPFVDARNATMYVALLPLAIFILRRGWQAGLRLICYGGYIACGIAVVAWVLLVSGVLAPTTTTFVYFLSINDVRPGGEILVVVLAVLLAFGKAPLAFGSRALSIVLVVCELLVSQTLSMFIAIVLGIGFAALSQWHSLSFGKRFIAVAMTACFAVVAVGGIAADSRFDLASRISQDSAQYRANEFGQVVGVLSNDLMVTAIGTGPGSVLPVVDLYNGLTDVKRDTHDSFANIAFKSGVIGLILYLMPIALAVIRLLRTRRPVGRTLSAAFVAVCVLSVTVPFIWTASGLTALMLLCIVAFTYAKRFESQRELER